MMVGENSVRFTDIMALHDALPIEIGYISQEDLDIMLDQKNNVCSLKHFYSIKNQDVVFLKNKNEWFAIKKDGETFPVTAVLNDMEEEARVMEELLNNIRKKAH